MRFRETLLDFAYFLITMLLVSYGLLLVFRGYLGVALGRGPNSTG